MTALTGINGGKNCVLLITKQCQQHWVGDLKRKQVIGCHISKKSVRDIATLLKLPKSVVGEVMVKCEHEGTRAIDH
jgi:hypothetical protein